MLKVLRKGKIRGGMTLRRHLNVCVKVVKDAEAMPD